jgi:hypothetical protein
MIDEDNVILDFAFSIFKRVRAISWDREIGNGKPAFSIKRPAGLRTHATANPDQAQADE